MSTLTRRRNAVYATTGTGYLYAMHRHDMKAKARRTRSGRLCNPFLKLPRLPPATGGRSASRSLFFSFSSLNFGNIIGGSEGKKEERKEGR